MGTGRERERERERERYLSHAVPDGWLGDRHKYVYCFLNIYKRRENNIVTPYTYHLDTKITLRLTLSPFSPSSFLFSLLHSFPLPPPSFVVTIVMIAAVAAAAEVFKSC